MAIATLTIDINAKLATIERDLGKVAHLAEQSAARVKNAFGNLDTALKGIAGLVAVQQVISTFKSLIDLGDQMQEMAQKTGVGVKELATFSLAAQQTGTSLESVARGIKGLSTYMVENGDALKAAGITSRDTNEALHQLADLFQAMPDGVEKTALAVKLFGKAGMDMIPMLNQGSEGLKAAAEKAAAYAERMEQLAPMADKFNDTVAEFQLHARTAGMALTVELLPGLQNIAEAMREAAKEGNVLKALFVGFGGIVDEAFAKPWGKTIDGLRASMSMLIADMERGLSKVTWGEVAARHIKAAAEADQNAKDILAAHRSAPPAAGKQSGETPEEIGRRQLDARKRACTAAKGSWDNAKGVCDLSPPKAAKRDEFADLLNEGAGLSKNFYKDLDVLHKGYTAGRVSLDGYIEAVSRLIDKQPFAIQQAKDTKKAIEDQVKVYERVSDVEDKVGKQSATFAAANAQRLLTIKQAIDSLGKSPEELRQIAAFADIDKQLAASTIAVTELLGAIGATDEIDAMVAALTEMSRIAKDDAVAAFADLDAAIAKTNASFEEGARRALDGYLRQVQDVATSTEQMMLSAFRGMEDALVDFVMTGKLNFKDLVNSILADIARIAVKKTIMEPFTNFLTGLFKSADGNVFSGPGIGAYSGTVVDRPTLFPFASGIGLMGEAGAEAILPLKRGASGKLGVEGGGSNVVVNVIESPGNGGKTNQRKEDGVNIVDVLVERVKNSMASDITDGRGAVPAALANSYGLNRGAGAF